MAVKKKSKRHSFRLTLSEKEGECLKRFAADQNTTPGALLRRFVKDALHEYAKTHNCDTDPNQLSLFDCLQVDIFNNVTKIKEDK